MPHILSQNAENGWLSGNFKGILFKQLVTYEYVRSEKLYWILLKNKKMQRHFIIISSRLRVRKINLKISIIREIKKLLFQGTECTRNCL
jgi:hypothetical protein